VSPLRDDTAKQLARLLSRHKLDNPWSDRPGTSTRVLYSTADLYSTERLDVHDQLIAELLAAQPDVTADGTLVVVTAGVPGAGKSTAVAQRPELAGCRHIDADDFKDGLLVRARDEGLLDGWLTETLGDGLPVAVRELASFVHAESTVIAAASRDAALERGENLIVHGTLAHPTTIDDLLGAFDLAGYERIRIIDVEVPREVAVERSLARWWEGRTGGDLLGGRFVPPADIERYYPKGAVESITRANAEEFARRAEALEWDVTLEYVDA